jgi:hypothetical protein
MSPELLLWLLRLLLPLPEPEFRGRFAFLSLTIPRSSAEAAIFRCLLRPAAA